MNHIKTIASVATCISALVLSNDIAAQTFPRNYGYVVDSSGTIVRNGFQECWRTGYWTAALAVPECERDMAPKAAPTPVVAPAPVPAPTPVVAPAPAAPVAAPVPAVVVPVPVAAPAPKPVETFKTTIVDKAIRLEGANFATGSSKLLSSANSKLDEVVKSAADFPEIQLSVSGYTDNVGNATSNQRLSQDRADAVKAYLTSKGVAANRISTKGFGADSPIADNSTADGRSKNRRVEVRYTVKEETKVRVTQ
jgi:OmpA-OmpF porin, OOP family